MVRAHEACGERQREREDGTRPSWPRGGGREDRERKVQSTYRIEMTGHWIFILLHPGARSPGSRDMGWGQSGGRALLVWGGRHFRRRQQRVGDYLENFPMGKVGRHTVLSAQD